MRSALTTTTAQYCTSKASFLRAVSLKNLVTVCTHTGVMCRCRRRDCACLGEADKYDEGMAIEPWWLANDESSASFEVDTEDAHMLLHPYCRGKLPQEPSTAASFAKHTRQAQARDSQVFLRAV